MNILITGGAGYIGTALVTELSKSNSVEKILVYDNLSRGNFNFFLGKNKHGNKIRFIQGDILDSRSLRKMLKDIDIVYHLAAKVTTPFANIDSHFFEQINHWGTAELIYAIEESGVKKFIFTSSASVYGSSSIPATEDTPPHPTSFYGISKERAEGHVRRLFQKIPTIIIRCGNVYGYNRSMRFDAVINRFMFDAHFAGRVTINGSGTQSRSFIHIDKVADVLSKVAETDLPSGTYNLSDKNLEILEILEALKMIYDNLEYFHINQHITMQELKVHPDSRLRTYVSMPVTKFEDELREFRDYFSF